MTAKAPTLAWLLSALACLLAGMAITEGRHRANALTVVSPVGLVVTIEVAYPPTVTPEPTPSPTASPLPTLAPTGLYPDSSAADFPPRTRSACDTGQNS
jgi:hypothetical protein